MNDDAKDFFFVVVVVFVIEVHNERKDIESKESKSFGEPGCFHLTQPIKSFCHKEANVFPIW